VWGKKQTNKKPVYTTKEGKALISERQITPENSVMAIR